MRDIAVGLIGSGYIGKTHTIAYKAHTSVFGGPANPVCTALADAGQARADEAATRLGFGRAYGDWRDLVAAPDIDVVAIATPNAMHKDMALAAIRAGKHVYIEKPLALDAREAREIAAALEGTALVHMLGYNYLCNPIIGTLKALLDAGEIGEILHFRGRHNEDYMADPATPWGWRCSRALSGSGTIGDMGSHLISMAMHLVGPVAAICGDIQTVIAERTDGTGKVRAVENEDQAHALVRFRSGAMGVFESSRIAQGKKQGLAFEIVGSKGSVEFDQERMNELRLYDAGAPAGRRGFKTILVDTSCPDFGAFCPAPGHGLGYNDLKVIEVNRLMRAITDGAPVPVNVFDAVVIEEVIDAWLASAAGRSWIDLPPGA
ncbi:MAG: Gfo/Idh/MocA family oxidoreductase [Alphaproteobacteria bacterium]|nr:MAG: Gfo/Idh/MocA family oxidoreductase [Alphaproteobacteria bacterium]